jgi:hypothetical protein
MGGTERLIWGFLLLLAAVTAAEAVGNARAQERLARAVMADLKECQDGYGKCASEFKAFVGEVRKAVAASDNDH